MRFLILALLLSLSSCGSDERDRENYGDLSMPPKSIILSDPDKHMGGFGRKECLVCHNAVLNIHRRPGAGIDVEELNRAIRNKGEAKYCLTCHGANGTQ